MIQDRSLNSAFRHSLFMSSRPDRCLVAPTSYLVFYLDHPEELLKWMLHERGIIDCPQVIAPPAAVPMEATERKELEWVLERIGWRKRWPEIP